MIEVLAIADDLTGAAEAGAKFAQAGIPAVLGWDFADGAPVVVIDAETRHLTADAARDKVFRCAQQPAGILYKKTDSTLRGNIGAELSGLLDAWPGSRIAYVPAYPAMGRTVHDGLLYVNGIPLHQTAFAADPLNPVTDSSVRRVFDDSLPCDIFDASTDGEIDRIAVEILASGRYRLIAGPAAIAGALAVHLPVSRTAPGKWPAIHTCLIVNGSMHPASALQIEAAQQLGHAGQNHWRVFDTVVTGSGNPLSNARATGAAVRDRLAHEHYGALMVFGGDTALAIVEALGSPCLWPLGEVLPGVVISRVERQDWLLITKAGGFGAEHLIGQVKRKLNGLTN